MKVKVTLNLPKASQIAEKAGLANDGDVQQFHTQNVLRRIQKFIPYKSGALIKLTIAQTDINRPEIVTEAPQAAFLYYGKLMVSDVTGSAWARKGETKHVVAEDLTYNQEKNPQAGPMWDKALVANEGNVLVRELQAFINRR